MISNDSPFNFEFEQEEVEHLCKSQLWESSEPYKGNEPFGLAKIFKEYAGLPQEYPLRLTMEHGLKFDDNQSTIARDTPFQAVLTPSEIRTPIIERETGKRAIPIGFGFLYSKSLFGKFKLKAIPENERKGTLVFPFKSTPLTTVHFDHAAYATTLNGLPERFQPVYVCLYWADVTKGLAQTYQDAGIPIVTAGHRHDPLFFHRFYDLCRRFRYAASNDIGTNLFLSIHSGCRFFYLDGSGLKREVTPNRKIDDRIGGTFERNREQSRLLFADPVEEITREQRDFVNTFLGTKHFLSPKNLRRVLLREQRLFEKRPWWYGEKQLLTPPDASAFTWDELAPCRGWYVLEKDGETTIRWMGRTNDAWVDLRYPRQNQKLTAVFNCHIHCMACEHLEVRVNNINISDIKFTQDGNKLHLEGLVPPDILEKSAAKGIIRIGFHVTNAVRPNDVELDNAETRRLGVAVSHISLRPKP